MKTKHKKKKTPPLKTRIKEMLNALLSRTCGHDVVKVTPGFHSYSRKNPVPKPRPKKDQADT